MWWRRPTLTRQLLYTEADIGQSKVKAAVERLRAMNSRVVVTGEECQVGSADDVERFMAGCDVLVLAADQPEDLIQSWTNEAALRTRTPWFMSFYTGPMTVIGSFLPYQTGCYMCMWRREGAREVYADAIPLTERRPNAVIAASANVSGHMCALEVLYFLAGLPQQVPGRRGDAVSAVIDGATGGSVLAAIDGALILLVEAALQAMFLVTFYRRYRQRLQRLLPGRPGRRRSVPKPS